MPAAIPIAIGVSSLIGYAGAKSAAKSQEKAADKSLALQERMFNQTRADQQPYMQAGQSSLSALTRGMGLSAPAPSMAATPGEMRTAVPRGGLSAMRGAPAGNVVQLRAPDGSVQAVPQDQAEHYMARGAQRVG